MRTTDRFLLSAALAAVLAIVTAPAFAHPGDHAGLSLADLAAHALEWDHLAFLALALACGLFGYRAGRRAEARANTHTRSR